MMEANTVRLVIESALMAYGQPLSMEQLQLLFAETSQVTEESTKLDTSEVPAKAEIEAALGEIEASCQDRGFELKKVSSGWRFQVRPEMAPWVNRLWEEKPQRYSRALLETLSIIAYRQPITRGDIEEIRGVAVSSNIIKTLSEREWVKVVGHRDVPGRPALFATTRQFLDYFNLESLDELPSLRELADIDTLTPELGLNSDESSTEDTTTDDSLESTDQTAAIEEESAGQGEELDDHLVSVETDQPLEENMSPDIDAVKSIGSE